jgi:hypothetical protein
MDFCMKRLRTWTYSIFKYSRLKLKHQNPIAIDVLFKAYPTVVHVTVKSLTITSHSHADLIWPDGTFKSYTQQLVSS